jgi:hypothetical protein
MTKAEERLMKVSGIARKYDRVWEKIALELAETEADAPERVAIQAMCGYVLAIRIQLKGMAAAIDDLLKYMPEMRKQLRDERLKEMYRILMEIIPGGGKPN